MAKEELKTAENEASVEDFIFGQPDAQVREDCEAIVRIMSAATGEQPRMWGADIIGFGQQTRTYATGKEMDWMLIGFSPRKANITLYLVDGFEKQGGALKRLGKHSMGKSCLYIDRLSDIKMRVLEELVEASVNSVKKR